MRLVLVVVIVSAAAAAAVVALSHRLQDVASRESATPAGLPATATPSPSLASSLSSPVSGEQQPSTVTDRAAAGETAAMQGLSSRPPDERRAEETLALAKGSRIAKQRELEEFGKKLREQPDLLRDHAELARLRGYIDDGEISVDALALVAELPGPLGPDLLYETWTSGRQRPESAKLAQALLLSQEVGAKTSPALKVLLDLHNAQSCEAVVRILPRAKLYADQRAIPQLKKLNVRRGCGNEQLDDCYPCLRKLDRDAKAVNVAQVLAVARQRPPPAL